MSARDLGVNIRRYMKFRGISAKALAAQCGIGAVALSNIINGKAEPRSSTLVRICKVLGQGPDKLLADNKELKTMRFRTQKTMSSREKAAREQLVAEIGRWLDDYLEIEKLLNLRNEDTLPDLQGHAPVQAAMEMRKKMSMSPDCAVYSILDSVENIGIKIKLMPFGLMKVFGLSVHREDGGPAIIVNNEQKISIERQIFTGAHELGHLALHKETGEISDELYDAQEDEANHFASEFLMPQKAFMKEWERLKGFDWKLRVLEIKKLFKVSYMTVIRRIVETMPEQVQERNLYSEFRGWYKVTYNHDFKDHFEPEALCAESEPSTIAGSSVGLESSRFRFLVRRAWEEEHISLSRAAEILGISLEDMNDLAGSWKQL